MYIVGIDIGKNDHKAIGHCWLSLYSFLLEKGYTINIFNPIQSDSFRNLYIRQTKKNERQAPSNCCGSGST